MTVTAAELRYRGEYLAAIRLEMASGEPCSPGWQIADQKGDSDFDGDYGQSEKYLTHVHKYWDRP